MRDTIEGAPQRERVRVCSMSVSVSYVLVHGKNREIPFWWPWSCLATGSHYQTHTQKKPAMGSKNNKHAMKGGLGNAMHIHIAMLIQIDVTMQPIERTCHSFAYVSQRRGKGKESHIRRHAALV